MIFYLDDHTTKCASYYAIEHLRPTMHEAIQILSDATRVLIDECRVYSMEKLMHDAAAEVTSEKHYRALEQQVPRPMKTLDDPLVDWIVMNQDAFDWLMMFAEDLLNELKSHYGHRGNGGPSREDSDAISWLRVHALRPVNAGRILQRAHTFPLPSRYPKEFVPLNLLTGDPSSLKTELTVLKTELTVRAYRLMYWTKYRNTVRFTKSRRPWWWDAFENTKVPILASDSSEK